MTKTKSSPAAAIAIAAAASVVQPFAWWNAAKPIQRHSQAATSRILRRERVAGKRGNAPRRRAVNKWHKKPRRAFLAVRAKHRR